MPNNHSNIPLTAIDLFCGSGGVTAGLKSAGWKVIAAVDNDPIASETYRLNHPEVMFLQKDITNKNTGETLEKLARKHPVDLVVVCAPCQPFSSQNRKRGGDPREQLIIKSIAIIKKTKPKLIFFENVPGLAGPSYRALLETLRSQLSKMGYVMTDPTVEDAADYGVPQRRRRCIMVGAKSLKALSAFKTSVIRQPQATVHDAIGELPALANGQSDPEDPLHFARIHSPIALKRLQIIPVNGGSRRSLPRALELECHRDSNSFPDVYGRMKWNSVAPTLTTGCTDVTKGRFAHPEQDRAITLREAARLQTFGDDYQFTGNKSQISRQIGNAVPPAMVAQFAQGFSAAIMATATRRTNTTAKPCHG